MSRRQKRSAVLAVALAAGLLGSTPAAAATADTPSAATGGVLISEVVSGGPSGASDNFIEIANFGSAATDIGGYRIFRCGQAGDAYGPQAVVPEGTVLAPGEQYLAVRAGSPLEASGVGDASYDTSLHSFGYGAYLEAPDHTVLDRIGFYHPSVDSQCKNPTSLPTTAAWTFGESHQRVGTSGDIASDWIVAERTPGEANRSEPADRLRPGAVKISEYAPGGPGARDDFIEIANYGDSPVDLSGWSLLRCGDNAQTYTQHAGLPSGTTLAPGEAFTFVRTDAQTIPSSVADARYSTSVHWQNSGAMLLDADTSIVDRMSVYRDRQSPCTDGEAAVMDIDTGDGLSFQRNSDTGDNSSDFVRAQRTPGEVAELGTVAEGERRADADSPVRITELSAAGPAGGNDEYVELLNTGDAPVSLSGWSLWRCEGTGKRSLTPQIADLAITLAPGQRYI
ncbi:lamin tail domain-containing protein, partial [Mycetocola reblochoni]